jgi:hypothetical protein
MFAIKVVGYDIDGEPLLLADGIGGEGRKILVFSSKESADKTCKEMNVISGRMKTTGGYEVIKIKKEWIEGMSVEHL